MGKYLDKNLGKGEEVVGRAKVSRVILLRDILFIVWGWVFWLIPDIVRILTTELGFTNKKLLGKYGFINTKVMNSPLEKVNNVAVSSGLLGKIFGYGTVEIQTASGAYTFKRIHHADAFRTNLMQAIETAEENKIQRQAQILAGSIPGNVNKV